MNAGDVIFGVFVLAGVVIGAAFVVLIAAVALVDLFDRLFGKDDRP